MALNSSSNDDLSVQSVRIRQNSYCNCLGNTLGTQLPLFLARSTGDLNTNLPLESAALQSFKKMDRAAIARRQSAAPCMASQSEFNSDHVASANDFLQRRRSSSKPVVSGMIQPDLYRRQGSVLTHTVSSGANATGKIRFKLKYDFAKSDFIVTVLEVANVRESISEYFVRVQLKPDLDKKKRESVKYTKSKTDRSHHQEFKFALTYEELLDRTLQIQLLATSRMTRVPVIAGEVTIELQEIDPSAEVEISADFEQKSQLDQCGELLFSINYLPSVERLTVTVHEAKELPGMDLTGGSDPYVKVCVVQDGKVVKKRKSSIRKNTLTPVWNEPLNFSLPQKALKKCHVELLVMDHDLISNDDVMGQIVVGRDSTDPKAVALWEEFMAEKTTGAVWIKLRRIGPDDSRRDST